MLEYCDTPQMKEKAKRFKNHILTDDMIGEGLGRKN
jgi:hypothetical protein